MAQFLSQNEIDDLLSQVDVDPEETEKAIEPVQTSVQPGYVVDSNKVHKLHQETVERYTYNYISPVIKKECVIYNPTKSFKREPDKKAVFVLEQYRLA